MHAAVEAQLGMDFVGDDPGVLLQADICHGLEFLTIKHLAQRVVRIAQQQRATAL
ncbi:hypothetical protein D3C76_790210 [compost metagenome]